MMTFRALCVPGGQVQEALLHSQRAFRQRVVHALAHAAFFAWAPLPRSAAAGVRAGFRKYCAFSLSARMCGVRHQPMIVHQGTRGGPSSSHLDLMCGSVRHEPCVMSQAWGDWRWATSRAAAGRSGATRQAARVLRGWMAAAAHRRHVHAVLLACAVRNQARSEAATRQRALLKRAATAFCAHSKPLPNTKAQLVTLQSAHQMGLNKRRLLGDALETWADATAEAQEERRTAAEAELHRRLAAAEAEAARLAADNARYTRLIDDPEWGGATF